MDSSAAILNADDPQALPRAIATLAAGGLVALPTETVYGLAGISTLVGAVAAIYEAKRRPRTNPLISHVSGIAMAERYVRFDPVSRRLAQAFWPGPLTLILPLLPGGISRGSTNGGEFAAIRAPEGFAQRVIAGLDLPLAAPSANSSGRISPTTAQHVAEDLGAHIPLIIDGGATRFGVESTVVQAGPEGVAILRPGVLTPEGIAGAAGVPVISATDRQTKLSPGTLESHYAPRAAVRLNARQAGPDEALLTFGPGDPPPGAGAVFNLSPSGDLAEAARNLFALMHRADATGAATIAVVPIPDTGLGQAINDRLRRAASPRS
ncbi:L-threonylcarbamoyladenylate synthase [Paracoccus sp. (in: a-proteobacteria)]|uniref:L-threonylcarbamoyladenylate synthase n=1 Tax=Paracoccus sp. TaxID=267 RepID=UPI003A86BF8E